MKGSSLFKKGNRYLVRATNFKGSYREILEIKVIELSPTGDYMKACYPGSINDFWVRTEEYEFIEQLAGLDRKELV
jgi:hypothetical protein